MKSPGQIIRLIYINYVIARYGLDQVVLSTPALSSFRFLSYFNPWNWRVKTRARGESIRLTLQRLGPIFVKFGQVLSTRRDFLPGDIVDELEKLQDQVPPFPGKIAKQIVEQAYGCPLDSIFKEFNLIPLASASIAQVHAATLIGGKKVVVKVLRPNIEKTIRHDVALLYAVARLTERFWSHGRRLRPRELVAEFERTIIDELDLMREAANASQLRRNFLHSPALYIPEVYWDYARTNVLVMERISGIPISDIKALNEAGVDLKKLAARGVEIFFTQVFRDSFFHADMHPGNIFVAKGLPHNPQYIAVDFGIVGSLSPNDQYYLAENILAFFKRDYRRVAVLHVESGWVPADTRVEEFESAIRSVCEPIFEKPLAEISFGQLLVRLFQVASRFHMEVQPQLLLLQKTLLNIEGLGRQLYPDLDLWTTGQPILERWLRQRYSVKTLLRKVRDNAPYWTRQVVEMPMLLTEVLHQVKNNQVMITTLLPPPKRRHKIAVKNFILGVGAALVVLVGLSLTFFKIDIALSESWQWILGSVGVVAMLIGSLMSPSEP